MQFEMHSYDDLKKAVEDFCAFLSELKISAEKIFDSRLALHELLANVLQHAKGGASLQTEVKDGFIRIRICGEEVFCPPQKGECPQVYAERGRGLFLVDCVSEDRTFTKEGEILVRIRIE